MAYTEEIAMALEMIQDAGGQVTLRRPQAGTVNVTTDRETAVPAVLENTPYAVLLPLDPRRDQYTRDSKTLEYQRKLLFAASGMTMVPQAGDEVTVAGVKWVVVDNVALAPDGGSPIIHKSYVKT